MTATREITHHVLPIDNADLARLEGLAHLHGDEDVGRKMTKTADELARLIALQGVAALGGELARHTVAAKRERGNSRGGDDIVITYFSRLAYADIDGAAGALLTCLARRWRMSREDALARCIPDGESGRTRRGAAQPRITRRGCRRDASGARG